MQTGVKITRQDINRNSKCIFPLVYRLHIGEYYRDNQNYQKVAFDRAVAAALFVKKSTFPVSHPLPEMVNCVS